MSASEHPLAGVDLRMPLAALAMWGGAWCGITGGWAWAGAGAAVLLMALAAWRRRSLTFAVAAACALVAGVVAGLWWWATESSPLVEWARDKAVVSVEAQVTGDPVVWPARGALPAQTVVAISVRSAQARGLAFTLRQDASLTLTGGDDPAGLAVGQRIAVTARASWPTGTLLPQVRLSALQQVRVLGQPGVVDRALNNARAGLRASMGHSPPDQAGLVPGLVVGDTSNLSATIVQQFRVTSLSHLTAVSGTNLTLMVVFLVAAARVAGVRGWWLRGITVAGVVLFVILCRGEPSVIRAAAMGTVALMATGVGGSRGSGLRNWGVAVGGICLVQPAMSHSWGFAMSAAATAGILWWSPVWSASLRRWAPGFLAEAIAIPLAAQVATQPLVTALNGQISLVGVFANMVAAPFVGPVTVLGLVACLLSTISHAAATVAGFLAGWCSQPILLAAGIGASLPGATTPWGSSQWGSMALALVLLSVVCWLIAMALPHILRRWWSTVLALVVLAASTIVTVPSPNWPGPWAVAFCDVGQGDAAVIKVGTGVGVLVDAGPDPPSLWRCLSELSVKRLALVIFSHEHADHVAGAQGLATHVQVDAVLLRAGLPISSAAQMKTLLGSQSVSVADTWTGQTIDVGPLHWVTLRSGSTMTAMPTTDDGEGEDPAANNASTIGLAQIDGVSVLFTGDAEPQEQAVTLDSGASVRADVLKVPHHGSSQQDAAFLSATRAAVAVISVGAGNPYGHPAARTVNALQGDGMSVYRTDQWGAVALTVTDGVLRVQPQHRPP